MLAGLLIVALSGFCLGIFLAPLRGIRVWQWEHVWTVWSIAGMLVAPVAMAAVAIPHVWQVYKTIGGGLIAITLVVGAVAGISGFLYSRAVPVIGLALATALNCGSGMAVGSLAPLVGAHRGELLRASGILTIAGVLVACAGIYLCSKSGGLREREQPGAHSSGAASLSFVKGLVYCIVAGALASCMNLGLAFQNGILETARRFGASEFGIGTAFLSPYMAGGFFSNFVYALWVARSKRNLALFVAPGSLRPAVVSTGMGMVFALGVSGYALGLTWLGSFGPVVGWGILTSSTILTSGFWDLAQKEWSGRPLRVMVQGIATLVAAVALLALGQYFHRP